MKILIVGDYSSLGLNLYKGLTQKNQEVKLLSNGDSWKQIEGSNLKLLKLKGSKIKKIFLGFFNRILLNLFFLRNYKNFDIIIMMNQEFITTNLRNFFFLSYPIWQLKRMKKNENSKIFLLACGDDYYYYKAKKNLKYFPHETDVCHYFDISKKQKTNFFNNINRIIPCAYDYAEAYRNSEWKSKVLETLMMPVDLKSIKHRENIINNKIVIFHGLNREEFKGTKYIKKAMEDIKKKYPEQVEIIIKGNMPLNDYKELLSSVNIIIDQCKVYSYGMNALYGMALGKVVFSGNKEECQTEYRNKDIPVVDITSNVEDIVNKIEYFIKNPDEIIRVGNDSRKFVEKFHDSLIIADKYLEIFKEKYEEE